MCLKYKSLNNKNLEYEELLNIYGEEYFKNKRFLEIGPKDGEDTERLRDLSPKEYILFDLPDKGEFNSKWTDSLKENEKLIIKNHVYETPCILRIDVSKGHKDFLKWVETSVNLSD